MATSARVPRPHALSLALSLESEPRWGCRGLMHGHAHTDEHVMIYTIIYTAIDCDCDWLRAGTIEHQKGEENADMAFIFVRIEPHCSCARDSRVIATFQKLSNISGEQSIVCRYRSM